jgi:hypothetical protein
MRKLSKREEQLLKEAPLSVNAAKKIGSMWAEWEDSSRTFAISEKISLFISFVLVPLLIFILVARFFNLGSIPVEKGFENIAFFLIWAWFIILKMLSNIMSYNKLDEQEHLFKYSSIKSLIKGNVVVNYLARIIFAFLIGVLVFRGNTFTGCVLLISWLISIASFVISKEKISEAVKKLE